MLLCIKDLAKHYGKEIEERFSKPPPAASRDKKPVAQAVDLPLPANAPIIPGLGSNHMYSFITRLFYFGFKRPLIEALKELCSIQGGQYRMGIQTKLMNTIYIILTHHIDYFPVQEMIVNAKKSIHE